MTREERRKHPRHSSRLRCWLQGRARTVYVRIRDLSRGGLGIRAPTTFSRGELADVVLEPGPSVEGRMRARGEVVWSHPDPDNPHHAGTGLRFVEVIEGEELLTEAEREP